MTDPVYVHKVDTIVTESSVYAIQLAEGTGLSIGHPLDLLLPKTWRTQGS